MFGMSVWPMARPLLSAKLLVDPDWSAGSLGSDLLRLLPRVGKAAALRVRAVCGRSPREGECHRTELHAAADGCLIQLACASPWSNAQLVPRVGSYTWRSRRPEAWCFIAEDIPASREASKAASWRGGGGGLAGSADSAGVA